MTSDTTPRAPIAPRERHIGFRVREPHYDAVIPGDANPTTIVDVGALYDSTGWLRERFPGAKIIATNVLAEYLRSMPDDWADKYVSRAETLADDLEGISEVDMLFLGEVLEHIVYPQEFLEQAVRLLRVGGLIVVSTPNLAQWHNRLLMLGGWSPSNYSMIPDQHLGVPKAVSKVAGTGYGDHVRVFTYKALRELFSQSPWELVAIRSDPMVEPGRPLYKVRNAIGRAMPKPARENVFLCARLVSKALPEREASAGFVGSASA